MLIFERSVDLLFMYPLGTSTAQRYLPSRDVKASRFQVLLKPAANTEREEGRGGEVNPRKPRGVKEFDTQNFTRKSACMDRVRKRKCLQQSCDLYLTYKIKRPVEGVN